VGGAFADTYADYWPRLIARANSLYRRLDASVVVRSGYEHREEESYRSSTTTQAASYTQQEHTGPYGLVELRVPLYSGALRIERAEKRAAFLKEGAELIRKIEESGRALKIKSEEMKLLEISMPEEGAPAIKLYYEVRIEMERLTQDMAESIAKLEGMLN